MFGMRMCFWLITACVLLLSSCLVTTSDALVRSCTYYPRAGDIKQAQIYRVGDAYYLKLGVRYVCKADRVIIGGIMAVPDSGVKLPIGYHDERRSKPSMC